VTSQNGRSREQRDETWDLVSGMVSAPQIAIDSMIKKSG